MNENGGGHKFDLDAFNAALNAKGARVNCPVCDAAQWYTASDYAKVPMTEDMQLTKPPGEGFESYCMICRNCGFVRLHSALLLHTDG